MRSIVGHLAYNFSVVIILAFLQYSVKGSLRRALRPWQEDGLLGLAFGAASAVSIFLSVPVWNGVLLDSKMILGALAGFYGGWRASLLVVAIAGGARLWVGGMGAFGGILGIVLCAGAGVIMRRRQGRARGRRRLLAFAGLGLAASCVQVLVALTLRLYVSWEETVAVIATLVAPTAVIYTPVTLALGAMFGLVDDRARATEELKEAKARLEELNASLEARIEERTSELRAAQDRLIRSEKMVSLGHLVSSLVHELSSPVAAITSGAGDLAGFISERLLSIFGMRLSLNDDIGRAFDAALGALREPSATRPVKVTRAERQRAREALASTPLADSEQALDLVVELCPVIDDELVRELARSPGGLSYLGVLEELVSLRRSLGIVTVGADRIARTIRLLGELIGREESKGRGPVSIRHSVEAAVALLGEAELRGVRLERALDEGARVVASPERLTLLWLSLLRNAVQAVANDGLVRVVAKRVGPRVVVTVADDGLGIPEAATERVFEPFFSTRGSGEGMGLSLSVSRLIVEDYGGTIGFRSGPGGTTFTVELPEASDAPEAP